MGTYLPSGRLLDPNYHYDSKNRPIAFKQYATPLKTVKLPKIEEIEPDPALPALAQDDEKEERFPYIDSLAHFLHYSNGITKTLKTPIGPLKFRAASCTGALYHIEMYVITSRLPGLQAGIYHYDALNHQLNRLRAGDYRMALFAASGENYAVEDAPTTIVYTSQFWRNAYKYQNRAFRHMFWDAGTILANSIAMATALDLYAPLQQGFVDHKVAELIGIDQSEELVVALLPLGYSGYPVLRDAPQFQQNPLRTPDFPHKRDWPEIIDIHLQSSLESTEMAQKWRATRRTIEHTTPSGKTLQLRPQSLRKMVDDPLEAVITRRGSTRKFSLEYIDQQVFANIMKMGTQPIVTDFYSEFGDRFNQIYIIVNGVFDIPIGSYRYIPKESRLIALKEGYFREEAKKMGLNQDLAHDAAVNIFFIADLAALLDIYGNRGYRLALLEAAILGGKIYLAAYAHSIGATGLTFADQEVLDFFFEDGGRGKMVSFMVCIGKKGKKSQ